LPTNRLRTTEQNAPYSIETGTLNHAAIAGVKASIEFIAQQGEGQDQGTKLKSAMERIGVHERNLATQLFDGIEANNNLQIIGQEFDSSQRAPTISFIHHNLSAIEVCRRLADNNIFAWDGHFYAIRAAEVLGLLERGGVTRMGISAYTSKEDIDFTLQCLDEI
jgi:selenocysteine lyase/cysteine desulfurase